MVRIHSWVIFQFKCISPGFVCAPLNGSNGTVTMQNFPEDSSVDIGYMLFRMKDRAVQRSSSAGVLNEQSCFSSVEEVTDSLERDFPETETVPEEARTTALFGNGLHVQKKPVTVRELPPPLPLYDFSGESEAREIKTGCDVVLLTPAPIYLGVCPESEPLCETRESIKEQIGTNKATFLFCLQLNFAAANKELKRLSNIQAVQSIVVYDSLDPESVSASYAMR